VEALTAAAVALAGERRTQLLEFRCSAPLSIGLPHSSDKVTSVVRLAATVDAQWTKLGAKLRAQIRRPQKEGIEMRFGTDQIAPFFAVFARCMRDLGSPTRPLHFYREIAHQLGERACAYLRGKPVAGGCALQGHDDIEMTWASALREHNRLAPNMLLYWSFIEHAIERGLHTFNFGRSTPGSGAHRFKLQWGAQDLPLYWYRSAQRAGAATPRPDRGLMALAARVWRHVPVPVATLIGARLRGGIPA
jgi:lipid II:glycine glycyltransferase (peptidoglycan interpeptide bridge formation enzyme)